MAPTVLEIELPKHGRLLLVLPAGAAPVPVVGMVAPAPPVSVTLKRSFLLGPEFRGGFPCLLKLFPAALHFLHVAFPENECRLLYGSVHVGRSFLRSDFMSIFREKSWFILFTSSYRDCQISFGDDPCSIIFSHSSVKVVLFFQWCLCPKNELLVLGTYDEKPHIFIPFIGHFYTRVLSKPLFNKFNKWIPVILTVYTCVRIIPLIQ